MRVILDTNILISALINPRGVPDRLYHAWLEGRFDLVTSEEQLDEFRRVSRYPRVQPYLQPAAAGALVNELRLLAIVLKQLPTVEASKDPGDNFLLGMAQAGEADYLVTGDHHGLLELKRFGKTLIVTARQMLDLLT